MAADASLIKGAAAMAEAEAAAGAGIMSGITKGAGEVMAQWAKYKAEDARLDKELMKWSQGIQGRVITDDPDLRDAATAARDEIGKIAMNKDLDRDEQRKRILEIQDNFVIAGGQSTKKKAALKTFHDTNLAVGDNVSKAYDVWEGKAIAQQLSEGTAEELKDDKGYSIGWKFKIPPRTEGGEATTLEVGYDDLQQYAKRPADRKTITSFRDLVTRMNKQTEPGKEQNTIGSIVDSYNVSQKKEILSNMEDSVYVPTMTDDEVEASFRQHVTNNVRAEKEDAGWEENRAMDIAGVKRTLDDINKIEVGQHQEKGLVINNLPTGFRLEYYKYEDGTIKPVIARGTQKYQLEGDEKPEKLRQIMRGFYVDKIEKYNIDVPQYVTPKPYPPN